MSVDALDAAYAAEVGDITAVRGRLYFDQADPVTAVARFLRTHCVDGWHQFLGEQIGWRYASMAARIYRGGHKRCQLRGEHW